MNNQKELVDRFNEFQAKVRKLQTKPQGLEQELSVKRAKLDRLKAGRSAQLALDETGKAEVLAKQIKSLETEIETIEVKIAAFGLGGSKSAQSLVQNAPDSELYNMAKSIVEEAAEIAPGLEKELQHFVNLGADEEKEKYLKIIEGFSEKLHTLWDICRAGLYCQQFLPEDFRQCKKPLLIAPGQAFFEVDEMQIAEAYRPLSRTSLPD